MIHLRSDAELLAESRPGQAGPAFATFYERHERTLLAYFRRRVASAELAADLAAETFARALAARHRYRPQPDASAVSWLFGIARHVLARSAEQGRVEDQARRRLGIEPVALDDERLAAVDRLGEDLGIAELMATLPADQRDAIRARIVEERGYSEIAARLHCSEAVVRKRVSRGLATLRRRIEELDAALR